jgi:hypothetical protein
MSEQPTTQPDSLSLLRRVDALCLQFEDHWLSGQRPAIEDSLATIPAEEQATALTELLLMEWSCRDRLGETFSFAEYVHRFPTQRGAVEQAVQAWEEVRRSGVGNLAAVPADAPPQDQPNGLVPATRSQEDEQELINTCPESRPTSHPPALHPAVIGPYRLLEEIGRGGMGVVYKAQHVQLGHHVALKVVKAGAHATRQDRERFRREGEALVRLQHPHVVRLHHFDEHEGQPYFVMELLAGSLAKKLAGQPRPEKESARLVESIARAVHAAHRLGIVHRDLKPGNVLLDDQGTPKVTDFGLAKLLDADGSHSLTIGILGTPSYMAPEMARGDSKAIGPAVDNYALGAILYECLTGRPPFKADTSAKTLDLVRTGQIEEPSRVRPKLSRDLEAVCLKCLAKEPKQRYGSAQDLADDLRNWLEGRSTKARPLGVVGRTGRELQRRPRLVACVAAVLVLVVGLWLTWVLNDPDRPINQIEAALARGEKRTLIGETGRPVWSRLAVNKPAKIEIGRDGTLYVNTWSVALLELVRDPQLANYRLSAEVRHEEVRNPGEVGIYVGHQKFPGEIHSFLELAFNDITGQNVLVGPHLLREAGQRSDPEYTLPWKAKPLQPAGSDQTGWRRLAVEVRPGSIRACWEGEPIGAWTTEELAKEILKSQRIDRQSNPPDPLAFVPSDFAPRGALGLYVKVGSAYFRRVVLEPLSDTE